MWIQILLFCCISSYAYGARGIQEVKVGEHVVLSIGKNTLTWTRTRKGDVEEFIKHCKPSDKDPKCKQFVTKDDKKALPETSAKVFANGTFVIDSFKASDAGTYSSPDLKPVVTHHKDGSSSANAPNEVVLVLKE